jgi:hypothetical protein
MMVEANREGADTSLLTQLRNGNKTPKNGKREHPSGPLKYHPFYGFTHRGGDDLCWKIHAELKVEYDKRKKQDESNKQEQLPTTTPRPSAGSMKFQSGIHGVMVITADSFQIVLPTQQGYPRCRLRCLISHVQQYQMVRLLTASG